MGKETKYDYIYYTVLDQDWFDTAERILTTELTTERLINAIERKLKQSKDWTLNNLKVDYSQHCDDIDHWIRRQVQHKEQPVFIQVETNQPVIRSGSGTLFVFYEEDEEDDDEDNDGWSYSNSSGEGHGLYDGLYGPDGIDGLSGAGGRL